MKKLAIYAATILLVAGWVCFIRYNNTLVAPAVSTAFGECPRTPQAVGSAAKLLAQMTGLQATEHPDLGGVNPELHGPTSFHPKGTAVDFGGSWYDYQMLELLEQELKKVNCLTASLEGQWHKHVHMEVRLPEPLPTPSGEETLVETCTGSACIAYLPCPPEEGDCAYFQHLLKLH